MGVRAWNHTKIVLSFLLSLMFLMAAGCAQTTEDNRTESDTADGQSTENDAAAELDDKHVTFMFSFKVGSLDPHNDMTPLRGGVTETLVKLDEDLNLEGWLATDWEAIDETTWQFTLREGVTFHDGTEMDAEAVKASFQRGIEESDPLASALQIESMEADGHTLTIETIEPHPALPSELVNPYTSVISVAAEEEMGTEAFNNAPVGTGPFKVAAFSPNIEVQLERNDH
jgi:peptide/nickel transport system substrate-binding protein